MFCANCGTKQNEGEKFCPNCGTKFEEPLKADEVKTKETIKSETSEPKENVLKKKDTTVQSKTKTPKTAKVTKSNKKNEEAPESELKDALFKTIGSSSRNIIYRDNAVILEEDKSISLQNNNIAHNVKKPPIAPFKTETLQDEMEKAKIISEIIELLKRKDYYGNVIINSDKQELANESFDVISRKMATADYKSKPIMPPRNDLAYSFKEIKESQKMDVESILRLAIRYELGLGVPIDNNKADEFYKRVKKECLVRNLYKQNNLDIRTGVISDTIQIKHRTIFDSVNKRKIDKEEERRYREQMEREQKKAEREKAEREKAEREKAEREKAEREKAEKQKLIKEMYSYHKSWKRLRFKLYINATKEQVVQLNKKVCRYNNGIKGFNYDKINYDKEKGLVEGCFEKKYTDRNIGFIRSLFIPEANKQRELTFERMFIEVADFCETIKIKL